MNENWPRWILASVDTLIRRLITESDGLSVYNELQRQPPEQELPRLEYAINGPSIFQPSTTTFLEIQLVVLVSTSRSDTDWQAISRIQGVGQKAMPGCIPVYKYGTRSVDDQTKLGILVRDDLVKIFNSGHQDKSNSLRQVGLMANYRMDL